jgi:hypothetical protein
MTRQMFWRSGAAHEGMFAPSALGRKWWGMLGALGALGATAYLLPGFADGRSVAESHSPEVADIEHASNNADVSSRTPLNLSSSPGAKWQDLPLLALQNSIEIAAGDEVRLLALQAAFERERKNAAAAQLQVDTLQEQLASLREKQEEVLILREQLADAKAQTKQTPEPAIAETEQKRLAENALLKVTALQAELASLSAQLLRAKTTAESERTRAASAVAQLEAVQHQLAAVTALQDHRPETESHLRPIDDRSVDGPPLDSPGDIHPAERTSKPSLPPETNKASSIEQRQVPLRTVRPDKSERATTEKPRQALLSIGIKPPARPVNKTAAAPVRTSEPDASRLTRPRHEPRNQSVPSVGKPLQRAGQQPRLVAQEIQDRRDPGALSLPRDLLPDSRLW